MNEEKKYPLKKILTIILILIILLIVWARYINTKGLKINEYAIINKEIPASYHGLKIIHFSDILYGQTTTLEDIKKIVLKINELNPDIVVYTGDLFNKNIKISDKELKKVTKELKKINVSLYKYAISGDSDNKNYNSYKNAMESADFNILNNTNELLYYKSEIPIKIIGLTDTKELENAFNSEITENLYSILLIHKPDMIDDIKDYDIDLALAGHSLGGQIKVPFIGGIIKKNGAEKYIEKNYKVNNTDLYVSNGIGTENLKFRFLNKPSINLYRLYSK